MIILNVNGRPARISCTADIVAVVLNLDPADPQHDLARSISILQFCEEKKDRLRLVKVEVAFIRFAIAENGHSILSRAVIMETARLCTAVCNSIKPAEEGYALAAVMHGRAVTVLQPGYFGGDTWIPPVSLPGVGPRLAIAHAPAPVVSTHSEDDTNGSNGHPAGEPSEMKEVTDGDEIDPNSQEIDYYPDPDSGLNH